MSLIHKKSIVSPKILNICEWQPWCTKKSDLLNNFWRQADQLPVPISKCTGTVLLGGNSILTAKPCFSQPSPSHYLCFNLVNCITYKLQDSQDQGFNGTKYDVFTHGGRKKDCDENPISISVKKYPNSKCTALVTTQTKNLNKY